MLVPQLLDTTTRTKISSHTLGRIPLPRLKFRSYLMSRPSIIKGKQQALPQDDCPILNEVAGRGKMIKFQGAVLSAEHRRILCFWLILESRN